MQARENAVLIPTFNNLALVKQCIESVRNQDIETNLWVWDNGSTDGTREWLDTQEIGYYVPSGANVGVSVAWNALLSSVFNRQWEVDDNFIQYDHALVLNSDAVLPSFFYRKLLACDIPFVTGCPAEAPPVRDEFDQQPTRLFTSPCFSAFLIRRDCWQAVGPFDEEMFGWASDCDYHVRAHLLGIKLQMAKVPFGHRAGTTMRTAPPEMQRQFGERANKDRAVFCKKWGCEPGTPEYDALFDPALFGINLFRIKAH